LFIQTVGQHCLFFIYAFKHCLFAAGFRRWIFLSDNSTILQWTSLSTTYSSHHNIPTATATTTTTTTTTTNTTATAAATATTTTTTTTTTNTTATRTTIISTTPTKYK